MAAENCNWEKRRRVINRPPPSTISKLEQDLLLEVLIRVPDPSSACRCKLVCKRWNSLISEPYFNRRFLAHHRSKNDGDPSLLIASDDPKAIILSFLPVPNDSAEVRFRVFDSFKDLVLCGVRFTPESDPGLLRSLFVCNPFTKQWVALPLMPEKNWRDVHVGLVARLVCEPRCNPQLDLGDDQVFVHSDYRFRVVCIYQQHGQSFLKLDVFCSESGEWTKAALVFDRDEYMIRRSKVVVSSNGRLFCCALNAPILEFDPFHLDRPPIRIDVHPEFVGRRFDISVSQGVLHVVKLEGNNAARPLLTVWRREASDDADDHVSWRELYRVRLEEPLKSCDRIRGKSRFVCLHPDKPEIVFLKKLGRRGQTNIWYHDLKTGEEGVFPEHSFDWKLFQLRISCWPTPIPSYEKLRDAYDGRYSCWVQQSTNSSLPEPTL